MSDGQTASVNTAIKTEKKKRRLPGWAGWLLGWAGVLAASAGLVYCWRVVYFEAPSPALPALPMTAGVAGLFSLLYLGLFLLCRLRGDRLCLKAALVVFAVGLLFCFATAPLQAPDEHEHYLRAYAISQGSFTYNYNQTYPEDVALLVQYFPGAANHEIMYGGRQMAPHYMLEYRQALEAGEAAEAPPAAPVMFLLLPFLHQGLFMAAARLFGLSALGLMYAGRIANLLLYCVLCYFTFKNCDKYRGVFFAFALLPLSLFMAASCSYDGPMLALCYFLLSFFCKSEIRTKGLVAFLIALAVASYIKPLNVVLAALLLLIPKSRWKSRFNPWLVTGAVAAVAVVFWYATGKLDADVLKIGYPELPRGSGEAPYPEGQILYMLQYPFKFVAIALHAVYQGNAFLFDLGRFGWMDLSIPVIGGLSVVCLCMASALGIQQKEDTRPGAAAGLGLAGLLYGAAVLAGMYVLDTDYMALWISGQQPRYFLPAFLLLFMLGSILLGKAVRPRLNVHPEGGALRAAAPAARRTEALTLWIAAGAALLAAVLLFQNYYIGQWIPKAEGGWKLVNMFGWAVL